jgi:molybdate transport system ATP-binding protein
MKRTTPETISSLFTFENVTLRIRDRRILKDTSWQIEKGTHWVVVGPNGSGKTTLLRSLTGNTPVVAGKIRHAGGARPRVSYVGPELYRLYLQDDARREVIWSPVTSGYPVTTPKSIAEKRGADPELAAYFFRGLNVEHLVSRGIRTLSTGEMQKVLLAAAAAAKPDVLILDEPFDGLDVASVAWFRESLANLDQLGVTLILASHRRDELAGPFKRALMLEGGRVVRIGSVTDAIDHVEAHGTKATSQPASFRSAPDPVEGAEVLVDFAGVTVGYNGSVVLDRLNWQVREGENWCVAGPNGSGKTTILNLICGDNLQAYANNIRLFGRRRGSGESIWDIKQHIGYITPHLSARYDKNIPIGDVILSGLFDSVGLYRWPSPEHVKAARKAAEILRIESMTTRSFAEVSAGERMSVLIARALVKEPKLLILDEPCQGLDPAHRNTVLDAIDRAGSTGSTNVIYVTHREDEIPGCINRHLTLEPRTAHHSYHE